MDHAHDGYLYIASPYTHDDPMIRQRRYEKALDFTAWLAVTYRMWCYSPIVHSHPMDMQLKPGYDHNFWMEWGKALLIPAKGLIVLQIPGWQDSAGVNLEIEWAREIGHPMYFSQNMWGALYDHAI